MVGGRLAEMRRVSTAERQSDGESGSRDVYLGVGVDVVLFEIAKGFFAQDRDDGVHGAEWFTVKPLATEVFEVYQTGKEETD